MASKSKRSKNLNRVRIKSPRGFLLVAFGVLITIIFTLIYLNFQTKIKAALPQTPLITQGTTIAPSPTPVKVSSTSASVKKIDTAPEPVQMGNQLRVPVLMYHYISDNPNPADKARYTLSTPPDKFDAELQYLSSQGYTPITLDTMYAALKKQISLPAKPIILTFDDGYIDFYVNAYPILRKYNFHAVSFIPTGLVDQGYYLHWNQIKEMQASGLISFEAHSVHHPNLTSLSDASLNYELTESKKVLEQELGIPVNFMAYPFGTSDQRVQAAAIRAGYLGSAGTWASRVQSEGTIYNMPRVRINGLIDLKTFISLL